MPPRSIYTLWVSSAPHSVLHRALSLHRARQTDVCLLFFVGDKHSTRASGDFFYHTNECCCNFSKCQVCLLWAALVERIVNVRLRHTRLLFGGMLVPNCVVPFYWSPESASWTRLDYWLCALYSQSAICVNQRTDNICGASGWKGGGLEDSNSAERFIACELCVLLEALRCRCVGSQHSNNNMPHIKISRVFFIYVNAVSAEFSPPSLFLFIYAYDVTALAAHIGRNHSKMRLLRYSNNFDDQHCVWFAVLLFGKNLYTVQVFDFTKCVPFLKPKINLL